MKSKIFKTSIRPITKASSFKIPIIRTRKMLLPLMIQHVMLTFLMMLMMSMSTPFVCLGFSFSSHMMKPQHQPQQHRDAGDAVGILSASSSTRNDAPSTSNDTEEDTASSSDARDQKVLKATKIMTGFTNSYLKNTDTRLCDADNRSIPAVVIKGLAEHKVDLGAPLCPCRFYEDKAQEVKDGYWNCPCVPMREEKKCHCMLFLTEDSPFAGTSQVRSESHNTTLEEMFQRNTDRQHVQAL